MGEDSKVLQCLKMMQVKVLKTLKQFWTELVRLKILNKRFTIHGVLREATLRKSRSSDLIVECELERERMRQSPGKCWCIFAEA